MSAGSGSGRRSVWEEVPGVGVDTSLYSLHRKDVAEHVPAVVALVRPSRHPEHLQEAGVQVKAVLVHCVQCVGDVGDVAVA